MGELVTDLLELARIDEAKPLQLAEVDLVPLAHDAALDTMASSPDRTVQVLFNEVAATQRDEDETSGQDTGHDAAPSGSGRATAPATGPIRFAGARLAKLRVRRPRTTVPGPPETGVVEPPPVMPSAVVLAEENKIRQVLTNLIGNALRFTPAGRNRLAARSSGAGMVASIIRWTRLRLSGGGAAIPP